MDPNSSNLDVEKKIPSDAIQRPESSELQHIDKQQETRLLRKVDLYMIPVFGLVYLFAFLDRGNIGNAKVAGMATDLNLVGNQYGTCVSVVYATYVVFEPIYVNLLKILTPRLLLSVSSLVFGILTLSTAWSHKFTGLVAIRVLLGCAEAGIFPSIVTYFAMTYRREELGRRLSYIFTAAALSGAFGGLIAYGLTNIRSGGLASWQWIYVVEGILSISIAPVVFFWVPSRIDEAWFLSADERQLCMQRYEINKTYYDPDEHFMWWQVRAALSDWKTWNAGVIQFAADVALYGISTFMPIFIKGFGYSSVNSQLLTVPVYIFGAISFIIQARISDKHLSRSPFIFLNFCFQLIGYIVLATTKRSGVRYFGLYIVALGLYTPTGMNVGWTQNNHGPHFKRATAVGIMQLIGNSAGACIGYIFSALEAPYYREGFYISIAVTVLAMILIIIQGVYLKRENQKKAAAVKAGAPNQPELGDRHNAHFTYII